MSVESEPASSSSGLNLIPKVNFKIPQTIRDATKVQPKIAPNPVSCPVTVASSLVINTASSPHMPAVPCTEIAPTGSSHFNLSKSVIDPTTIKPPIAPMIMDSA